MEFLKILRHNFTFKSCKYEKHKLVREGDLVKFLEIEKFTNSVFLNHSIIRSISKFTATSFLEEKASEKIDKKEQFKILTGPFETAKQRKTRTFSLPSKNVSR